MLSNHKSIISTYIIQVSCLYTYTSTYGNFKIVSYDMLLVVESCMHARMPSGAEVEAKGLIDLPCCIFIYLRCVGGIYIQMYILLL